MMMSSFLYGESSAKFVAGGLRGLTRRNRQRHLPPFSEVASRAAKDPTARAVDCESKTPDGSRRLLIDGHI